MGWISFYFGHIRIFHFQPFFVYYYLFTYSMFWSALLNSFSLFVESNRSILPTPTYPIFSSTRTHNNKTTVINNAHIHLHRVIIRVPSINTAIEFYSSDRNRTCPHLHFNNSQSSLSSTHMAVFSLSLSDQRHHTMVIINFLPIWFRLCLFSYNELMRITRSPLSAYTQNSPSKCQNGFHRTRNVTEMRLINVPYRYC